VKTNHITFLGALVAVLVAGGYVLYVLSKAMPIPGGKFLVMGPYLSLIMLIALLRLKSVWSMTFVSLPFAVVISAFTPVMGAAIISAGILSDITGRLLFGTKLSDLRLCLRAALYPMWAIVLSLSISDYLTGNLLYGKAGLQPLILGAILAYALGIVGAFAGLSVTRRMWPYLLRDW